MIKNSKTFLNATVIILLILAIILGISFAQTIHAQSTSSSTGDPVSVEGGNIVAGVTDRALLAQTQAQLIYFPLILFIEPEPPAMVYVPAGVFLRGTNVDPRARPDEKPQRSIYLDGYWIYQTHVTNEWFVRFINETGYQTTAEGKGWSLVFNEKEIVFDQLPGAYWEAPKGPGSSLDGLLDHPVVHVGWDDAVAYCAWAGGRLPTEAEWEKAARGTEGYRFPWGNSDPTGDKANFCDTNCPAWYAITSQDDGYLKTSPAGHYPNGASPYGVLDMAGNVTDWVVDWYGEDYYTFAPSENPTGPGMGTERVHRGGSWWSGLTFIRSASRSKNNPIHTHDHGGFRCVFD